MFITAMSFVASILLICGVVLIFCGSYSTVSGIVCLAFGLLLYFSAKAIAKSEHVRKLHNNLNYTKNFVLENPDAHQYCYTNNPKYAQYCDSKIGQSNFNPSDYKPQ